MSTKFSYWVSNKDKSLKKSTGCMTGIFQLFNRQFLLTSPQLSGQYNNKSSSADETICLCKLGADYRECCNLEQNRSRSYQENSTSSMESSTRTSLSSSSTSSSSLKNRAPKEESKSFEQSFSSVRSPKNSTKPTKTDINQSPYKDLKKVSIEEKAEAAVKRNRVLKPVDSPRPIDPSKMKELDESIEILIKIRDLPRNFNESRVSPRFSFDGRISTDIKQSVAQKEQRRLSLDSMKDSLTFDLLSKVNSLVKELEMKTNFSKSKASNLQRDLRSNENQTNNIVAKLMGLGPINSDLKSNSNSRLAVEETQRRIESAYNVVEKTLQKLELRYNSKEMRDLKRAMLETKISAKISSPTGKTGRGFNGDGGRAPTGMKAKSLNSSVKGKGGREGDNSVSPRLKKRGNPDQERKSRTVNPHYGLKKDQKQTDKRQQSEPVSPSCRIRQKSKQAQLNERKPLLLQQPKGKTAAIAASASNHKQHQMLVRKVVLPEEIEKIVPQSSSPNSVLNGSSYQDDPPLSPLSISTISNAEEENPPPDHNLKITHLAEKAAQKLENRDTEVHKFILPGSNTGNKIDPDNKFVAEVLLSSGILPKDSNLAAILKQMKLFEPSEDLLRRSNGWDRFDGEVPVVVLEIERLIFVDLIDEIAGGLDDVVLEPKQRYRGQLLM